MLAEIEYGLEHFQTDVRVNQMVGIERRPPVSPVQDLSAAVAQALEKPSGFPALRRALTPDDRVAIVLGERLPRIGDIVLPLLEHLMRAHVRPQAITIVTSENPEPTDWLGDLPATFRPVRHVVHDREDRKRLSYLATTKKGRRIYLNRTIVDADQLVVVSQPSYDPLLGYGGCEGAIFPALSDLATQQELFSKLSMSARGDEASSARREAAEVTWLLGAPFMLHIIPGYRDTALHVVAGLADTVAEGIRLLDQSWRVTLEQCVDLVVAGVSGKNPTFRDLADALGCAFRIVKPEGKIVLLCQGAPALGAATQFFRQAQSSQEALRLLKKEQVPDVLAAYQWASTAQKSTIYLLSDLTQELAEEMFTTPLDHPGQVQRLVSAAGTCAFISEADKTLAVVPTKGNEVL
jgi:nickel-dependent lactate racemase